MNFDIRTAILALAVGNLVLGLILQLFQFGAEHPQRIPFLAIGKMLQGVGWLLLYERGALPDFLSFTVGNIVLIVGTAYDSWAMYRISQRPVSRVRQVTSALGIIALCILATPLSAAGRVAVTSFTVMVFFALGGWVMLSNSSGNSLLRRYIGWSMELMVAVVSVRGAWAALAPAHFTLFSANTIQLVMFATLYYLMLTNGFGMLLLAKQITDRELRESEARFRLAFENANIGVCLVDTQGNLLRVNRQMSEIFGYSQAELENMNVNDITRPEYKDVSPAFMQRAKTGDVEHDDFEKEYTHKKGQSVWGQVSSSLVRNTEGEPLYFISHVIDITERKQAEEALKKSETLYRLLAENISDVIWIFDVNANHLRYISPSVERLSGYTVDEALNATMNDMLPPVAFQSAQEVVESRLRDFQDGRRGIYISEVEQPRKDGSTVWVEATVSYHVNEANGHFEVFGVSRNISERKQAESALRESEAKYRALFNDAPVLLWEEDFSDAKSYMENLRRAGVEDFHVYFDEHPESATACMGMIKITSVNDAVLSFFGARDLSHMRENLPLSFTEESFGSFKKALINLAEDQTFFEDETTQRTFSGEIRHVALSAFAAASENRKFSRVILTMLDITKRKRAEEALQKANGQLRADMEKIGQLQAELREQAIRDPLTKLYNRRYLNETLARELARAERENDPLSTIMGDIDHFKLVNDTYGHSMGDTFLVEIARLLKNHARGSDMVCRYGGEEFLLVLPSASLDSAANRAEEIRQKCAELVIPHEGKDLRVTMSFGVATYPAHGKEAEEIIRNADKALYQSKNAGRNRVTVWK